MEDATTDCAAFAETVVLLAYFKDLKDPRQQGKVNYPLDEILLLCLLAVLAEAETFVDIALFGCKKRELLRRFRPFQNGTPAHDHLGDILAVLDAEQFQRCFVAWVAALTGAPEGVLAIDGKTLRRSGRLEACNSAIHMVSAFAARQRLVLGQVKVAEKSNEIIAIPKLLDMLAIESTIVTIDAMGCQRNIAQKIVDRKADYVLALKGNQGIAARGRRAVRGRAEGRRLQAHHDQPGPDGRWRSRPHRNQGHHRHPRCRLAAGTARLPSPQGRGDGREHAGDSPERSSRRHASTSLRWSLLAHLLGPIIRSHWAIENSLHWVMDMIFAR